MIERGILCTGRWVVLVENSFETGGIGSRVYESSCVVNAGERTMSKNRYYGEGK